jgi:hypothetical protein
MRIRGDGDAFQKRLNTMTRTGPHSLQSFVTREIETRSRRSFDLVNLKFHCSYFAPLAIAVRTNGDVGASQSPCHSYRPPTHQIAASAIRSWRPVKK